MLEASTSAADLTRQLLTLSRTQPVAPQLLDLSALVPEMHDMLGRLLGKRIHITAATTSEPAMVVADAGQLEQAIINLAINARDAMPRRRRPRGRDILRDRVGAAGRPAGDIRVDSEPGRGTSFRIYLPRVLPNR